MRLRNVMVLLLILIHTSLGYISRFPPKEKQKQEKKPTKHWGSLWTLYAERHLGLYSSPPACLLFGIQI